jgi:hypothetical protein
VLWLCLIHVCFTPAHRTLLTYFPIMYASFMIGDGPATRPLARASSSAHSL